MKVEKRSEKHCFGSSRTFFFEFENHINLNLNLKEQEFEDILHFISLLNSLKNIYSMFGILDQRPSQRKSVMSI